MKPLHLPPLALLALALTGCAGIDPFAAETRQGFVLMGQIARDGHDAVGVQCSDDAARLFAALDAFKVSTGNFIADLEVARVARGSSLPVLAARFDDSCTPILRGTSKLMAILKLPKKIKKMIGG